MNSASIIRQRLSLTVLLIPLVLASCSRSAPPQRSRNVILICMDTVRADHLGAYGYSRRETTPTIDGLAARGTVFQDTSATAGWTKPSVPSILTGTYPIQHGVYRGSSRDKEGVTSDVLPARALTLAEVFSSNGYATAAFVKNAQLRRGQGFEQGFDRYQDEAGDARHIRWLASDWLESRDPERPFFLYLHFLDAHWPYAVPDEYASLFADSSAVERFRSQDWRALRDDINHGRKVLSQDERESLLALYDGSIRFIDDELGRLLAVVDRLGLAENTVVSVISDHGEEFLEHGRIGHGHGLYENLLSVPWILYLPDRVPDRCDAPCSLVDVFPTILTAAGLAAPESMVGIDRLSSPDASRPVLAEHLEPSSYQRSWRRGGLKLGCVQEFNEGKEPDRQDELAAVLQPGSRWEARVEGTGDDRRVVRLRLRSEDAAAPTEIKGTVTYASEELIRVNGVEILRPRGLEMYGPGAASTLDLGMMVKARGEMGSEGRFSPVKLKIYSPDTEPEYEIRGRVGRVSEVGVEIGGLWLVFGEQVDLEATRGRQRFDRELVVASLIDDESVQGLIQSHHSSRDLGIDPEESGPEREASGEGSGLEEFCRRLLEGRVWDRSDSTSLSDSELERLRAIGYAE